MRFIEQPQEVDALIVLPNFVNADSELTSNELEAVSGGLVQEMAAICWGTCETSCDKSCSKTCSVTDVTIPPVE